MAGSIGPYRILRKLGAGGMGDVFLAEDERLGRRVALKCPSDEWLRSPDSRVRLHREARAAAQLVHPNIATVHDVIDEGSRPYIVMEYVEGESLSAVAARGPLPVEKAVAIIGQIADGLSAAHAAGVIHRDLKPANVIITPSGQVKLLDFGVARITHHEGEPLTSVGQVVGTPGYVAPELLLGRVADERGDIYSAGMILYQLVSGRAPWQQEGDARVLETLLTPVPDLQVVAPFVPQAVARVAMRAVARDPKDRYQSAAEFRDAINEAAASLRDMPTVATGQQAWSSRRAWTWPVVVGVLVLFTLLGMPFALHERANVTARSLPVVAVLPLTNNSGDPRLGYVAAGIADTMSTKLAGVTGLSVVSRAEVHDALAANKDISALCRALGASYVVTGSLQQAADRVQVTLNVLSPDGTTITAGDIYEDALTNVFALQRRMAEDITRRLTGRVSLQDHQQLARAPTSNVSAISAYWRGRGLLEQPALAAVDQAINAFDEAVAADGTFALGYAGLGTAYWDKYELTKDPQWAGKAVEANEHARQLAPDEPEVRLSLAVVYRGIGRPSDAITELQRALQLQPTSDRAHRLLGDVYADANRLDEADAEYRAAIRIRPQYWSTYKALGLLQVRQHRYAEAIDSFQKITQLQPDAYAGYELVGYVHALQYDFDAARTAFEASNARGGSPATSSSLGTIAYYQGRYADAASAYEKAIAARPNNAKTHWNLADAYRRLDRSADARAEYLKAVALLDADLEVNAKLASARAIRATCLARLGRVSEAIHESDRALAEAPHNDEVLYHRVLVFTIAGHKAAAVDALREAVKSGRSVAVLRRDVDIAELKGTPGFESIIGQGNASSKEE